MFYAFTTGKLASVQNNVYRTELGVLTSSPH